MRGEYGEDLGRTWGDLGREIADAIVSLGNSEGLTSREGEDWSAYKIGDNAIHIDVKIPNNVTRIDVKLSE